MKKRMRTKVLGLVVVGLAVMVVSACGSMSKLKVREQNERSVELEERLAVNEDLRFDSRWLSGRWDTSEGWMLVLVESDSVIAFDPHDGFVMQGGRVLYQQRDKETSGGLSAGGEFLESSVDSLSESVMQEKEGRSSTVVDKEREATSGWAWSWVLLVGAIVVSLLVLRKLKWN